jgi:YesN/AraC family two-component response regulator
MTQSQVSPRNRLRVLIADDVQETRRSTRLMLSTIPAVEVVAIAVNGLQAVELAKQHHPDIVISDINMPEMNGLSLAREVIRTYPDIGFIIMSADAETDKETLHAVQSLGVQEFLAKPFSVDELERAVQRTMTRLQAQRQEHPAPPPPPKNDYAALAQKADEALKARRSDDQTVALLEQLAVDPGCDMRWLRSLAMLYVMRGDWGKLKYLAAWLEKKN